MLDGDENQTKQIRQTIQVKMKRSHDSRCYGFVDYQMPRKWKLYKKQTPPKKWQVSALLLPPRVWL